MAPVSSSVRKPLYNVHMLDQLPPLRWLVDELVPEKGLSVLFGSSGVGKSFFTLDLALRLSQSQPVVYVAAEGASGYHDRVTAWQQVYGAGGEHLHFHFDALPLLNPIQVESFIQRLEPYRPTLVILDTLARCMVGGNESSARSMGEVVQACARLQNAFGAAVLLVHHTGKDGQTERGSSALRGAADTMLRLSADQNVVCLSSSKSKDGAPFKDRLFTLEPVSWETAHEEAASSCVLVPLEPDLPEPADQSVIEEEWPCRLLSDRYARR